MFHFPSRVGFLFTNRKTEQYCQLPSHIWFPFNLAALIDKLTVAKRLPVFC